MVPEDLRVPRRGRLVRVKDFVFSSPSEFEVEVSFEIVLGGTEGVFVIDGTGVSVVVEGSGERLLAPRSEDDMLSELVEMSIL